MNGSATVDSLLRTSLGDPPWRRGVALYSVRRDLEEDFEGTLARLATLGYGSAEVRGYAPGAVPALRRALDGAGLVAGGMILEASPSPIEQVAAARALGVDFVVVPAALPYFSMVGGRFVWREHVAAAEMRAFVHSLRNLAEGASRLGIGLLYHLHDRDYQPLDDGWTMLDILLGELPSHLLKFEVDTGWLAASGADLPGTLAKIRGRVHSIHLKDHDPRRPAEPKGADMVAPGKGQADLVAMLAALLHCGARHCFIELEPYSDPWPELEHSQRWLDEVGY